MDQVGGADQWSKRLGEDSDAPREQAHGGGQPAEHPTPHHQGQHENPSGRQGPPHDTALVAAVNASAGTHQTGALPGVPAAAYASLRSTRPPWSD